MRLLGGKRPPESALTEALRAHPRDYDALRQLRARLRDGDTEAYLEALTRAFELEEDEAMLAPLGSALAAQLGCPEYRLRRLINRALGHRNFNAFLNSYRIREAQALLSDPSKARLQIAQVALELGFGSLAPFNRAFKAKTGETPTAYRQRSLLEAAPRRDDE